MQVPKLDKIVPKLLRKLFVWLVNLLIDVVKEREQITVDWCQYILIKHTLSYHFLCNIIMHWCGIHNHKLRMYSVQSWLNNRFCNQAVNCIATYIAKLYKTASIIMTPILTSTYIEFFHTPHEHLQLLK